MAKSKSKRTNKKKGASSSFFSALTRNRILAALLVALLFGTLGIYLLNQGKALEAEFPYYEKKVVNVINNKREARGLKKLTHTICFHNHALKYARQLRDSGKFQHNDLGIYLQTCPNGDKPNYVGEVLLNGPVSAEQAVDLWMNSPGHKAIIMSDKPNTIGIGVAKKKDGSLIIVGVTARCTGGPCGSTYVVEPKGDGTDAGTPTTTTTIDTSSWWRWTGGDAAERAN